MRTLLAALPSPFLFIQLPLNHFAMKATTTTAPAFGHGYENNLNCVLAEQHREQYLTLYTTLQNVSSAFIEGIQSVTLNTPSGSVTVPLYSSTGEDMHKRAGCIYTELSEVVGARLAYLEQMIARHEEDSQKEEAQEREGEGPRAEALSLSLPLRPMSPAEFAAMPAEARRAYDSGRAEQLEAA